MAFIQKKIYSLLNLGEHSELGGSEKKVNKRSNFDETFDIQHQLEHFEYVMICFARLGLNPDYTPASPSNILPYFLK